MKNRGSKTYAYFSPLVGSVGHHLMILKVAGEEEVVSMCHGGINVSRLVICLYFCIKVILRVVLPLL